MTAREMQSAFELEVNRFDSEMMVESFIIFYWLNEAQNRIVKTRYSGVNAKGESFEQTQKRTDDLRTLVVESTIIPTIGTVKPNSFVASLPADYMFALGEEVTISYINPLTSIAETKRGGITDCTTDTYSRQVKDPYSEHVLHYESASPLRLFREDSVDIITDGNYDIDSYYLRYMKLPGTISLTSDCELPTHIHTEIVTEATKLFLEAYEERRYETSKSESGIQE